MSVMVNSPPDRVRLATGQPNPSPAVVRARRSVSCFNLSSLRWSVYATRGALLAHKPVLTKEPFQALLARCADGLIGVRDRALLLWQRKYR
jgi:hypothetical protein